MKGMLLDGSMSNLTSASNEASLSSSNNKNEAGTNIMQHSFANSVPINSNNQTQTNKKKRNLPGNPDPEAEVIAMSPKTLMATNRFVCEICNKGFQRDQNLQLHKRGHNLPWKLKQRSKQEVVRKKVYVCPEPTCVHHEPAKALGDLTGIKKHFSRKHGEKKWKCEKCSKRYAVQSDWKAHSKICGTREYRCDCGTLFSRRDSFITHRAFCGALAAENARSSTSSLLSPNHLPLHLPINFPLKTEPQHDLLQPPQLNSHIIMNNNSHNHLLPSWLIHNHHQQINSSPNNASFNNNFHLQSPSSPPHMSATALLQKATQIGVTMSKPAAASTTNTVIVMSQHQQQHQSFQSGSHQNYHMRPPTTLVTAHHHHHSSNLGDLSSSGAITAMPMLDHSQMLHTNSLMVVGSNASYQEAYNEILSSTTTNLGSDHHFQESFFSRASASTETPLNRTTKGGGGNDELTRDFLGVTAFPDGDNDYLSMTGLDHLSTSSPYHHQQHDLNQNQNQNQSPWNT